MEIKDKNLHVQKENSNNFLNSILLEIYLKNNYFRNSLCDDFGETNFCKILVCSALTKLLTNDLRLKGSIHLFLCYLKKM